LRVVGHRAGRAQARSQGDGHDGQGDQDFDEGEAVGVWFAGKIASGLWPSQ
jgi:hypothetical protein